jgi:hypothetical protein
MRSGCEPLRRHLALATPINLRTPDLVGQLLVVPTTLSMRKVTSDCGCTMSEAARTLSLTTHPEQLPLRFPAAPVAQAAWNIAPPYAAKKGTGGRHTKHLGRSWLMFWALRTSPMIWARLTLTAHQDTPLSSPTAASCGLPEASSRERQCGELSTSVGCKPAKHLR